MHQVGHVLDALLDDAVGVVDARRVARLEESIGSFDLRFGDGVQLSLQRHIGRIPGDFLLNKKVRALPTAIDR